MYQSRQDCQEFGQKWLDYRTNSFHTGHKLCPVYRTQAMSCIASVTYWFYSSFHFSLLILVYAAVASPQEMTITDGLKCSTAGASGALQMDLQRVLWGCAWRLPGAFKPPLWRLCLPCPPRNLCYAEKRTKLFISKANKTPWRALACLRTDFLRKPARLHFCPPFNFLGNNQSF